MRELSLDSNELVATLPEPINEGIVGVYCGIIFRGIKGALPNILIVNKILHRNYSDFPSSSLYLIIEGNHKAISCAMMGKAQQAYLIENDNDLEDAREMAKKGVIDPIRLEGRTIDEVVRDISPKWDSCELPLSEYVKRMLETQEISLDKLPDYIQQRVNLTLNPITRE